MSTVRLALACAGWLVFFTYTAAPSLLWGDDAELQRIAITGEARTVGQSSAASHLLWQVIASAFVRVTWWLPVDEAGRVTLVSSIAAALTLLPLVATVASLSLATGLGRSGVALASTVAAISLGFSHTFWLLASRPDAYTIQILLLSVAVWAAVSVALVRSVWRGVVAVLAIGAALTNHVMILASVPGIVLIAISQLRLTVRRVGLTAGVGISVSAIAAGVADALGFPVDALIRAVLSYQPYLPTSRDAILVVGYLVYQFPLVLLLAFVARTPLARLGWRLSGGMAVLYIGVVGLMFFRYHPGMYVRDQYIFYLPSYLPVAITIGLGAGWLVENPPTWLRVRGMVLVGTLIAAAGAPVVVYPLAATVAGPLATRLAPARALPGRDPIWYYLWPPKTGYTGARDYVSAAFSVLPEGAVVLADWLPYQPMRYVQAVEGGRRDLYLEMINAGDGRQLAFLKAQSPNVPLYLADVSPPPYYEIDEIRQCFEIEAVSVLYRLTRRPMC
jgi:hypothetical protein